MSDFDVRTQGVVVSDSVSYIYMWQYKVNSNGQWVGRGEGYCRS